ncbi:PaaI family thioesterase [Sphingomonas sp. MMS24-JH45]
MTGGFDPPDRLAPMRTFRWLPRRAGSFFERQDADGVLVGTRITPEQTNSAGFAHGGFLLTFADFALSYVLMGITLHLSADFLRAARQGDWLETRIVARRRSRTIIFADAVATAAGKDALRMSGVFRPYESRS